MPDHTPLASIIIVNWNGREHLVRCLRSLESQTEQSFEVIVVDNASSDGSVKMIRDHFPFVRVVENDRNLGFAAANNVGIRQSIAPYVVTLNNDTEPSPGWLGAMVLAIGADQSIGMVASKMVFAAKPDMINSAGIALDMAGIAWDRLGGLPSSAGVDAREVFGPCAGAALYRRTMLDEVGLFDEDFFAYLEDVDLAWRARLAGWRCVYAPDALVVHVHSATGVEGSPFKSFHLGRNKVWCITKDYPSPQIYIWLPVIVAFDVAAVMYGVIRRRDLAAVRGRVAGLLGLPAQIRKRRFVQGLKKVPFAALSKQMAPLASPVGVLGRYRHLNLEEAC